MRTRLSWEWEQLDPNTRRAKVFGGWILHAYTCAPNTSDSNRVKCISETMTFVPDNNHQWHILQPLKEEEKKPSIAQDF